MFNVCSYCGTSDCWVHTNDEKSALDMAKQSGDAASAYYKENEKLKAELLVYHRMAASGVWVESDKYSNLINDRNELVAALRFYADENYEYQKVASKALKKYGRAKE